MTTTDPNAAAAAAAAAAKPVLPAVFEKYAASPDPVAAAAEGYRNMQSQFTKATEELKAMKDAAAVAANTSGDGKSAGDGNPPATTNHMTPERWLKIDAKAQDGTLTQDDVKAAAEHTGIPTETVTEFLAFQRAKRQQTIAKAQEAVGEAHKFEDVMAWLRSGKSSFSSAEVAGFQAMTDRGEMSWAKVAASEFAKSDAGRAPAPAFRDTTTQITHAGFASRQEYDKALLAANMTGDQRKVNEVIAKLAKTPEAYRASPAWFARK